MASNGKVSTEGELNQSDAAFIFECLKHIDNDKFVDLGAVTTALGYTNSASVGNRFRALRKRYGFENFEGKNTGPAKAAHKPTSTKGAVKRETNSSDEGVKPKKKRGAPRKGSKTSSKPFPTTEDGRPATDKGPSKRQESKSKQGKAGAALLAAAEEVSEEA